MGNQSEGNVEDTMWASHTARVRAGQPRIRKAIEEVTGWPGCDKLADFVVELILANQGTSGDEEPRPPCWRDHAPTTVQERAEQLSKATGRPIDDPIIQELSAKYRQELAQRFGLATP